MSRRCFPYPIMAPRYLITSSCIRMTNESRRRSKNHTIEAESMLNTGMPYVDASSVVGVAILRLKKETLTKNGKHRHASDVPSADTQAYAILPHRIENFPCRAEIYKYNKLIFIQKRHVRHECCALAEAPKSRLRRTHVLYRSSLPRMQASRSFTAAPRRFHLLQFLSRITRLIRHWSMLLLCTEHEHR